LIGAQHIEIYKQIKKRCQQLNSLAGKKNFRAAASSALADARDASFKRGAALGSRERGARGGHL